MAGVEEQTRARPAVAGTGDDPDPLPPWLRRIVRPRAAGEGLTQVPWALPLIALAALTVGVELAAPGQFEAGAGALLVIPVLAASWTLGTRALAAVLAVVVVGEVVGLVLGRVEPVSLAERLVAVAVVTVLVRVTAFSVAEARRPRPPSVDILQHSAQLIEAAEEMGSAEQLQQVVERARLLAVSAVRADRGNISRLEGDELVVEHDQRPTLPYARRRPLSRSRQAAEAIRTRRPVHGSLAGGSVGPDGVAWMVPAGIRYAISCPMIVGGEVVGVLGCGRCRDEPFTDADGETLLPIAKLAGLLLQNSRRLVEARQDGQIKSHFMALAAHELRTPLAVIRGYLSLLEDGTYPVDEAVETLVAKAQELESLVESLVMAARLEGGTLPRTAGELDMLHEAEEALDRVRPRARLEGARLSTRVLGCPHTATADRSHVALILNNLLNNALTYSPPPGDVTLEVRGGGDAVEVAVVDRGHGIPQDQHERIFQRFHRVDVGPARTAAGLGLGLTISQELAHLNGGELVLEHSAPGQGSVFVLRLQRVRPPAS